MATFVGFSSARGSVAPLRVAAQRGHDIDEMIKWVREETEGLYWYYDSNSQPCHVFMFSNSNDAFAFKLRWG